MSEKLTIEIIKSGKIQALCYSEWSGYGSIAIERTKKLLPYIDSIQLKNPLQYSIRLLEKLGEKVGVADKKDITFNDKEVLQKLPDFKDFEFNSCGKDLDDSGDMEIWATEESLNTALSFCRVYIDCDNKKIKLHIFAPYLNGEMMEILETDNPTIIKLKQDPNGWMSFEDFLDFSNYYNDILKKNYRFPIFKYTNSEWDDEYYSMPE